MKNFFKYALLVLTLLLVAIVPMACSTFEKNEKYTVKFDAWGGSHVSSQEVNPGEIISEPTTNAINARFLGWFLSPDESEKFDFSKGIDHNMTLYAHWSWQISFDCNGGTYNNEEKFTLDGISLVEPHAAETILPKKDGYLFLGWYENNQRIDFSDICNRPGSYTAQWTNDFEFDGWSITGYIGPRKKEIVLPCAANSIPIQEIDSWVLSNLDYVNTFIIPFGINKIGYYALTGCSNLKTIRVDKSNTYYDDYNNNVIIESSSKKLILGCKNSIIPTIVKEIDSRAFSNCNGLTKIVIPVNVTRIASSAFSHCEDLEEVIFTKKSNLEAINEKTFEYCQKLKTINLPWDITLIGKQAFSYTGLTSIMLPMYLTYAGSEIFKGCDNLGSIGCFPTSQPTTWAEDWIGCNNKIVCWGATYIDEYGEVYQARN